MKHQLTGWVNTFNFTQEQRKTLADVFIKSAKNADKLDRVNLFIDDCENKIRLWLSLDWTLLNTTNKEKRDQLLQLKNATNLFKVALDSVSNDTGTKLKAFIAEQFLIEPNLNDEFAGLEYLKLFTEDGLENVLIKLNKAIEQSIPTIIVKTNVSNEREIELLVNLASYYHKHFEKAPCVSKNTIFYNFCKALSNVTGYDFSKKAISDAVALYNKNSPLIIQNFN